MEGELLLPTPAIQLVPIALPTVLSRCPDDAEHVRVDGKAFARSQPTNPLSVSVRRFYRECGPVLLRGERHNSIIARDNVSRHCMDGISNGKPAELGCFGTTFRYRAAFCRNASRTSLLESTTIAQMPSGMVTMAAGPMGSRAIQAPAMARP